MTPVPCRGFETVGPVIFGLFHEKLHRLGGAGFQRIVDSAPDSKAPPGNRGRFREIVNGDAVEFGKPFLEIIGGSSRRFQPVAGATQGRTKTERGPVGDRLGLTGIES